MKLQLNLSPLLKSVVAVTKHGTIPYVRYGFLLMVYSNFVTIFDFKNVVTLKYGSEVTQGYWNLDRSIRHL